MPLASGTKLGQYEIASPLGAGGMGEVYRAHDPQLGRDVAIKVLPAFLSREPERLRRFEQEARAAAALNHPNILAVYQLGIQDGAPYLVSELLEGSTLREQLLRGPLPIRKAVDYAIQTSHGLAAAHEKGIVHRDLKPENLFVTKDGRIKILDFGLAKLIQSPSAAEPGAPTLTEDTEPGVVLGTVGYMSPEQVRGQAADGRADLFALGAILYEMLTGKRAFHKPTSAETMSSILNEEPPAISQIVLSTPPALQRVVQRCLEKSAQQRFHSACDLAFALEALSDTGSAPTGAFSVAKSRMSWLWIAGLAVGVATIAGSVVWLSRPPAVPVVETVTQLTDDGEPKTGDVETDGARIYLNEGVAFSVRIAQVSVSGGETVQVPTQLANAQIASIRKDGSALLVLVGGAFAPRQSMWLLSLPGGTARRVGDLEATSASLFPDGRVLYTIGGSALYVAEGDGSNPRKLAEVSPRLNVASLAFSPNGDRVVFSTYDFASSKQGPIYEMAADGTGLHEALKGEIADFPSQRCCAKWTPDGRYLLFMAYSQGRWDLWAMANKVQPLRGSAIPVRLTNGPLSYTLGAVSGDGKHIFVIGSKARGELVRYDERTHQFMPYLGSISALDVTYSRDGMWIAYISYPDHLLWRSRTDGSERLQLTYSPQLASEPRISPDGTRVAFSTPDSTAYVINMNGGTAKKIADNASAPDWSPDGNLVVVGSATPGKAVGEQGSFESRVVDLRTGKISVVPGSENTLGPWFVTQEMLVAANQYSSAFMLFDFKTGKWSELARNSDTFQAWAPSLDGKYLYCTTAGADPKAQRIRISDHRVETITTLRNLRSVSDPSEGAQINVAPDGSALFAREVGTQEIYALQVKWP